jgi:hypothetical protein
MKTFLKILLYVILFVFVVLLTAPIIFKKQILQVAREQANANVNAKVGFEDVSLSLIKKFPNLYVGLKEVSVIGIDDFEGDTLVYFEAFEVKVDLLSAIKMDSIKVKSISLIGPVMNAIILEDGRANWDIAKETADTLEDEPVDTAETGGAVPLIQLKKFEIVNGRISYTDLQGKMSAQLNGFNFNLSGDLSEKFTTLLINLDIAAINFFMDDIQYSKNLKLNFLADIAADLENSRYTINKNELSLNELTLGLEGNVEMKGEDIVTDLRYYTTNTSFKTLLSMVPAVYMKDFADLQTKGELKIDGTVIGTVGENVLPVVTLDFKIIDAMFNYPDLPKQVDNINMDLKLFYHGALEDSTTVDLERFHMEIAGNPIDLTMFVKTPMTDMHVNGKLAVNMDLATLADAIPLENTKVSGKVVASIDIMGFMSSIENEKYEEFKADGSLILENVGYSSADLGYDVKVEQMNMLFSPKYVHLKTLNTKIGESDIQLTGRFENFIPYVFENKTVKGQLDLSSAYLDLNPFMTSDTTLAEEESVEDTTAMTVVEVPGNIDFTLSTNLAKVIYDKLTIIDITGKIVVRDGIVNMDNLNLNTLGGFINMSGEYNTSDLSNPFVDFELEISNIDVPSAVEAFNTIEKLAPISKLAHGNISSSLTFSTFLEQDMTPRMNSIISSGTLQSKSIRIENAKTFVAIGEKLGSDKFKELTLNDLDLSFDIRDGKILVAPFDVKLGKGTALIGGEQNLDQSINYNFNLSMPRAELGSGASGAIDKLTSNAASKGLQIDPGENVNLGIKVLGTVTDPEVTLDMQSNAKKAVQAVKEQMVEKGKEEIKKRTDEAKAKANEEAQRIINNAEKQSEQVIAQARKAADEVKKEYYARAAQLEKEAEGKPKFARDIAKKAADKVRSEGDEKAAKILDEADAKSKAIMEKARKEAAEKTQ